MRLQCPTRTLSAHEYALFYVPPIGQSALKPNSSCFANSTFVGFWVFFSFSSLDCYPSPPSIVLTSSYGIPDNSSK